VLQAAAAQAQRLRTSQESVGYGLGFGLLAGVLAVAAVWYLVVVRGSSKRSQVAGSEKGIGDGGFSAKDNPLIVPQIEHSSSQPGGGMGSPAAAFSLHSNPLFQHSGTLSRSPSSLITRGVSRRKLPHLASLPSAIDPTHPDTNEEQKLAVADEAPGMKNSITTFRVLGRGAASRGGGASAHQRDLQVPPLLSSSPDFFLHNPLRRGF